MYSYNKRQSRRVKTVLSFNEHNIYDCIAALLFIINFIGKYFCTIARTCITFVLRCSQIVTKRARILKLYKIHMRLYYQF